MDVIGSRLDPEPRGIERRKEEQDQHRADRRAADQRIGHRSPEDGVREGDEGQHGGKCGQDHGPRALHRGLDDGVIVVEAGSTVLLDLFGQDQRIAHQDAGQSDQAQNGVEAEGLVEDEQHRHDADEAERRRQHDHGHRREGPHLQHDDDQHGGDHRREDLGQRGVGLGRLLDRSAHLDAVAGRKRRDQRLKGLS